MGDSHSPSFLKEYGPKLFALGALGILTFYNLAKTRLASFFEKKQQQTLVLNKKDRRIIKLALTGGPCGGKTTALNRLYETLTDNGITTYIVPQAATLIADSGGMINTSMYSSSERIEFQYTLLKAQVLLETCFEDIALYDNNKEFVVILCDRGLMDGKAYMAPEEWTEMLQVYKINEQYLSNMRYDAVIHLVTAADGAREYYQIDNNQARHETAEEALALDKNTQKAWDVHRNLHVLGNTNTSFEDKLSRVRELATNLIEKRRTALRNKQF